MIFLRGGEDVTGATLTRFFGFHVAILPGIFTLILAIHLLLVQRQGMSEPMGYENTKIAERKTMPFFPNFILRDLLLWLIVLNVLAIHSSIFSVGIGEKSRCICFSASRHPTRMVFFIYVSNIKIYSTANFIY